MARALALTHSRQEGLGALADWLPAAGLDLEEIRPYAGAPVPSALPDDVDALVVMGGPMGVADVGTYPWLVAEMALLRGAVAIGVPVLAVCLGAQLLGAACGGRVRRGPGGPELGLSQVRLTEAAAEDPLLAGVRDDAPVVQWHWDEVATLPPEAVLLAESAAYPHQAFRLGACAWGLQFHPETTPAMVARWAAEDAEGVRAAGLEPATVAARAGAAWPQIERTWRPVAQRFATLAGGRPPVSVRQVPLDDPVALDLVDRLHADIVQRYGGDDTVVLRPEEFVAPHGIFLVAELDGAPVGCGGVRRLGEEVAEVKRMYVDPAVRRRGVARALLTALEEAARAAGSPRLRLLTGIRQPEAVALYEQAGWTPAPLYGPAVEFGWTDALAYERVLSGPS